MALTLGAPVNARRLQDIGLSNTVALPTSAGTVNTGWINLGQPGATAFYYTANTGGTTTPPAGSASSPAGPYVVTERVILQTSVTASANGGNNANAGGNVLIYLQQALTLANGAVDTGNITNVPLRSNFATGNIAYLAGLSTNAAGATAAVTQYDTLPPQIYQYIRLQAVSGANTANMADATMTISVLF
jgi:hypothetical protein